MVPLCSASEGSIAMALRIPCQESEGLGNRVCRLLWTFLPKSFYGPASLNVECELLSQLLYL